MYIMRKYKYNYIQVDPMTLGRDRYIETKRQRKRDKDRQTYRETDGQTERKDRQTYVQRQRQK